MIAREIVDFLVLVMYIVFNDFFVWYLILSGIFTFGLLKGYKKDNKPYIKTVLRVLAIYYAVRIIVVILF